MIDILIVIVVFIILYVSYKLGKPDEHIVSGTSTCLKEIEYNEHKSTCYTPEEISKIWSDFEKNRKILKEETKE